MTRAICRCNAYEWPHRLGYGLCEHRPDTFEIDTYCGSCGKLTHPIELEHMVLSDCCRAEVYSDAELTQLWPYGNDN